MKHLLFTLPLIFAALLFMGAGRIGGQVKTRSNIIKETRLRASLELGLLRSSIPEKDVKEWLDLARENPVLLLQATSPGFTPLPASACPMTPKP